MTSARLAILGLFAVSLIFSPPRVVSLDWRVWLLFAPVPYVVAQYIFVRDFGQLSRFIHLFLYSYAAGFLVARWVDSVEELARLFLWAITLQALIIFFSFFSIEYRGWVAAHIVTGANFGADNLYRAPGFTSSAGSALSVTQSLGVLAGGILLAQEKRGRSKSRGGYFTIAAMMICAASCLVVGRTGLILSALFVLAFGLTSGAWVRLSMVLAVFGFVAFAMGEWFLEAYLPTGVSIDFLAKWMFGFLSGEDRTVAELASMPLPPVSLDSFVGYGLVSVVDGANPSGHDSGFVQSAFSMGFFVGGIFFVLYLAVLVSLMRWCPGSRGWLLVLLFFLLEFKEPFVFKYVIVFFLVSMSAVYSSRPRRNTLT